MAGLADRLGAVDGLFVIDSPVGGPTTITAELPWRDRADGRQEQVERAQREPSGARYADLATPGSQDARTARMPSCTSPTDAARPRPDLAIRTSTDGPRTPR